MRALLVPLFLFAIPAFALNGDGCAARLRKRDVPVEVREAFARIHKYAPNLMTEVYEGKVTVERRRQWTPFQDAVSARYSKFRGRKLLIIRSIDTSSEKAKQKFIWDIAQALFELQMEPWLWSKESLSAGDIALEALNQSEDEDALAYFALQMPKEWRDHYLEKASVLMRESYVLAASLGALEPRDIMEEAPPTGFKALRLRVGAASIEPNVRDFNLLRAKGLPALAKTFSETNEKPLLAKYYLNHAKRMVLASLWISTLAISPHLLEIPSFFEAQHEWAKYEESLHGSRERADSVQQRMLAQRRETEIARLKQAIADEEKKDLRDESLINQLKLELQENLERSPGTILKTDAQTDR